MRRIVCLVSLVCLLAAEYAPACTFCGGGGALGGRLTLSEHYRRAKFVARGKLKNPRFDPNGVGGTTEFHVEAVLKPDAAFAKQPVILLQQYLPVVGDTPPDYVVFCAVADGKPDLLHGVAGTPAVADYLRGAAEVSEKDAAARLGYAFTNLDSADLTVGADAFLEFARATDADIVRAKAALDPAKLRKLLTGAATPTERTGVFALMLGLCGGQQDAALLASLLAKDPLPDRVRENLGGFLAGLTLLDAEAGWSRTEALLTDAKKPFDQRLTAVGTVRFFQATRPVETRPRALRCYRALIGQGDLADVAIDDLRRWGWWDLTADVLRVFDTPTHAAPIVRRGIVRYALQCPTDEAKQFVAATRAKDAKLVEGVEEALKLYEPVKQKN
ncbi:RES domain-containing protein [Fimbriiglobus ruber]|uniref:HEAT repeat domain-containing protein n=1 Tax=Fimbriiglobus ruber TaxID=1908690 RepID=A0A225DMV7_9BACT|nr:RES domain-containing protein [Fimbriiglobus ruber]OWK42353.1 hypothetical protein FRUB_04431 [Fimbriiglobus ruber]